MQNRVSILPILVGMLVLGIGPGAAVRAQSSPAEAAVELLWPGGAPGALGQEEADKPSLTILLPPLETSTGMGVVVCPGGGYEHLAMDHEGQQIARWLNSQGIAAFILKDDLAAPRAALAQAN